MHTLGLPETGCAEANPLHFRHWNGERKTDTDDAKDADAEEAIATIMSEPRRVQCFALAILFPASVGKQGQNGIGQAGNHHVFQRAWRRTARGKSFLFSYQIVSNVPSANSTVLG